MKMYIVGKRALKIENNGSLRNPGEAIPEVKNWPQHILDAHIRQKMVVELTGSKAAVKTEVKLKTKKAKKTKKSKKAKTRGRKKGSKNKVTKKAHTKLAA